MIVLKPDPAGCVVSINPRNIETVSAHKVTLGGEERTQVYIHLVSGARHTTIASLEDILSMIEESQK